MLLRRYIYYTIIYMMTVGLGDTAVMLSWRNWFRQEKELVKGVGLFAQLGVTLQSVMKMMLLACRLAVMVRLDYI